jgi:hypothetical protein
VEASVDDILRVCGAQAVQISLLQAEVARLSNVSTAQYIEKNGQKYSRTDSGKWRPMTTHKTVCPSEGLWRNVAILADNGPMGLRLNCEVCGYLWLYKAETAEYPLLEGASGENTRQVFSAAGNSGYTNPERSR